MPLALDKLVIPITLSATSIHTMSPYCSALEASCCATYAVRAEMANQSVARFGITILVCFDVVFAFLDNYFALHKSMVMHERAFIVSI